MDHKLDTERYTTFASTAGGMGTVGQVMVDNGRWNSVLEGIWEFDLMTKEEVRGELLEVNKPMDVYPCQYCFGVTANDYLGNCAACGGSRKYE